jgi:hypothetical protein
MNFEVGKFVIKAVHPISFISIFQGRLFPLSLE